MGVTDHLEFKDAQEFATALSILDALAEARATVRFHKRLLPGRGLVVAVEVDGTEYEGATAAEALLAWSRRKR